MIGSPRRAQRSEWAVNESSAKNIPIHHGNFRPRAFRYPSCRLRTYSATLMSGSGVGVGLPSPLS